MTTASSPIRNGRTWYHRPNCASSNDTGTIITSIGTTANTSNDTAPRSKRPSARNVTHRLSGKSFRTSRWAWMSSRTRLTARWFDVYLKTTRHASPRTAETTVIESHPGSTRDRRQEEFAQGVGGHIQPGHKLRQHVHHSMYPRPRSRSAAARVVRIVLQAGQFLFDEVGHEFFDAAVSGVLGGPREPLQKSRIDLDLRHG